MTKQKKSSEFEQIRSYVCPNRVFRQLILNFNKNVQLSEQRKLTLPRDNRSFVVVKLVLNKQYFNDLRTASKYPPREKSVLYRVITHV